MNPLQGTVPVDMSTAQVPSPSSGNSLRISVLVDRLLAHLRGGSMNDNNELYRLCISLSRGIDYAVAKNEIQERAKDLPYLMKQVSQWRNDIRLHAAIMVLMISIKGACRIGWFSEKDKEELHILSDEIATIFCSVRNISSRESTIHHSISSVMSRFYPRMKMGEILTFVEATPGHGAFVKDFHIATNAKSPEEKVYLFVAQTDNTDTSSCIISPQLVNFLLNGKAVDKRTCVCKDPGPQIPTVVTHLVKYGTNFLQAVGQFNGKYIIVVAFMSMVLNPSSTALPDYIPAAAATSASDSDNDLIEGPSRISLNCPISFRRIKTPVKGHLCKHLQCFDFDNFVDINSRRPSWRCPHCSQSVCFTDIRIDQCMVKVLNEVGVNISHVKISADGSWEAVIECDDADKRHDGPLSHQVSTPSLDMAGDILDLTDGDTDMLANNSANQDNEKKPSPAHSQDPSNANIQIPSHMNMNNIHQNIAPPIENRFSRVHLPTRENGTSNIRSNVTMVPPVTDTFPNAISHGQTQICTSNSMQLPTHAIGTSNTGLNPIYRQSQIPASNNTQFQQHYSNHMTNDNGGRCPTPATHVTRIPIAVQALPAQTSAGMVSSDRQQQFSGFQVNHHQRMSMTSGSLSHNMDSQNWVHRGGSNVSSQQFGGHSGLPQQPTGSFFNSHQHQPVNHRIPNLVQTSVQFSTQVQQGYVGPTSGLMSNQQALYYANAAAHQAIQNSSWTPPVPAPLQTPVASMPVPSSEDSRGLGQGFRAQEGSGNAPADQNWRPSGRMRGSLSGQAYSDAFNQFVFQPTQPIQAASPPALNIPRPIIPPHLQVLMANNTNANGFQGSAGGSMLGGAGFMPRN